MQKRTLISAKFSALIGEIFSMLGNIIDVLKVYEDGSKKDASGLVGIPASATDACRL